MGKTGNEPSPATVTSGLVSMAQNRTVALFFAVGSLSLLTLGAIAAAQENGESDVCKASLADQARAEAGLTSVSVHSAKIITCGGGQLSKHPGVKKFLYAEDGLVVYERLTFDMRQKGVPTLHLYTKENSEESFFQHDLSHFTFQEVHKLVNSVGLKRKPDDVLAKENSMTLEQIRAAHDDWKRMIAAPGGGATVVH